MVYLLRSVKIRILQLLLNNLCKLWINQVIPLMFFRTELTRRLQALMQQHIQEAVSLLSLENGSQTPKALPDRVIDLLTFKNLVSWYENYAHSISSIQAPIQSINLGKKRSKPRSWCDILLSIVFSVLPHIKRYFWPKHSRSIIGWKLT